MGIFSKYDDEFKKLQTSKLTLNVHKTLSDLSPELQEICLNHNLSLKAAFFLWKNNCDEIPVCSVCGKPVVFDGKRFHNYCSKECQSKDRKSAAQKMKETNLVRYGNACSLNNKDIKAKAKETLKSNYGVEAPAKSGVIKSKMKATSLERYGVDNPAKNEMVKSKTAQTNLERFGNVCSLQSEASIAKMKQTMIEKYGNTSFRNTSKREQTTLSKYGVKCVLELPYVIELGKETRAANIEDFEKQNGVVSYQKLLEKYRGHWLDIVEPVRFKDRLFIKSSDIPKIEDYCKNSLLLGTSNGEREIFDI